MARRADVSEPTQDAFGPLNADDIEGSLHSLYLAVLRKVDSALKWYRDARRIKSRWSSAIRLFAIVLFSVAGLIPILQAAGLSWTSISAIPANPTTDQVLALVRGPRFDFGQLGYVAAALATAFLGLDKFFGFSSGWVRYMLADSNIRKAVAEFQMNWVIANTCLDRDEEERRCAKKRLQLLKDFSIKITDLLDEETRQWAGEFQGALSALDKSASDAQEVTRPGMIVVTIKRGAAVGPDPVIVYLDGHQREVGAGETMVLRSVTPGQHEVLVVGKRKDASATQDMKAVNVSPAGIGNVEVQLE